MSLLQGWPTKLILCWLSVHQPNLCISCILTYHVPAGSITPLCVAKEEKGTCFTVFILQTAELLWYLFSLTWPCSVFAGWTVKYQSLAVPEWAAQQCGWRAHLGLGNPAAATGWSAVEFTLNSTTMCVVMGVILGQPSKAKSSKGVI